MEFYEFIGVIYSMVLALGLAELLAAMPRVLESHRRYSVHVFWTGHMLFLHTAMWWLFWSYRDIEPDEVHYLWMLVLMAAPAMLYVASILLVSHQVDDQTSWRDHFERHRRSFFSCMITAWLLILVLEDLSNLADVLSGLAVATGPVVLAMVLPGHRAQMAAAVLMLIADFAILAGIADAT